VNRTNSKCYVNNPIKWKCLPLHTLPKAKVGKNLRKVNDEALLSAKIVILHFKTRLAALQLLKNQYGVPQV